MRVVPLPFHLLITHGWNVGETTVRAGRKGRLNDATEVCTRTKLCCNHVKAHSAHRIGCCNMQKTILPTEWVVATCKRPFCPPNGLLQVVSKKVCKLDIILIFALSNKKQQEYGTYTRTNFGNYFELHK